MQKTTQTRSHHSLNDTDLRQSGTLIGVELRPTMLVNGVSRSACPYTVMLAGRVSGRCGIERVEQIKLADATHVSPKQADD